MEHRLEQTKKKKESIKSIDEFSKNFSVDPELVNPYLDCIKSSPLPQKIKLESLILRPNVHFEALRSYLKPLDDFLSEYKRSEEHTSELQSRGHIVCRLLLEKKDK